MAKSWKNKECKTCEFEIEWECRQAPPSVGPPTTYPVVMNDKESEEACSKYVKKGSG